MVTVKTCFIVCPISAEGTETRKRSDNLLEFILTPACEEHSYRPVRVDMDSHNEKIDTRIITHLKSADLVIADVTGHNPNVFFELGYRIATGKPTIQIAETGTNLPFDIYTTNTIFYSTTDIRKANEAKAKISALIKKISEQQEKLDKIKAGEYEEIDFVETLTDIHNCYFDIIDSIEDIKSMLEEKTQKEEALI